MAMPLQMMSAHEDILVFQECLVQQHIHIQKVLALNFEMATRLHASSNSNAHKTQPQQDQLQKRLMVAEVAAEQARAEAKAQRDVNAVLKEEIWSLRNALAFAKHDAAEARGKVEHVPWEGKAAVMSPSVVQCLADNNGSGGPSSVRTAAIQRMLPHIDGLLRVPHQVPLDRPENSVGVASGEESDPDMGTMSRALLGRGYRRGHEIDVDSATQSHSVARSFKRGGQAKLFPDAEFLKQHVRDSLVRREHHVEEDYRDTGWAQALARDHGFKHAAFFVIVLNTFWIAVDTDYNKADVLCNAPLVFQVVDNAFCIFFLFEILVRFLAFKEKCLAFKDGWFVFDSTLVALMVWETWLTPALYLMMTSGTHSKHEHHTNGPGGGSSSIFRLLRIFRLTRVARLARLLNGMPELMVLIKGMVLAMRSVFSTLVLLVLIIFVFSVLFTQLLSGTELGAGCFDTVPESMNCLLLSGVFADQEVFIRKLLRHHWAYYVIIMVYMVVGSLTVMNMLIGIICEVVSVVAQLENEESTVTEVKHKLLELLPDLDADGDRMVSQFEFRQMVNNEEAVRTLDAVKVDCFALVECADIIFRDTKWLNFEDFVKVVLKFRDANQATMKDLFSTAKKISRDIEVVSDQVTKLVAKVKAAGHTPRGDQVERHATDNHMGHVHSTTPFMPGRQSV